MNFDQLTRRLADTAQPLKMSSLAGLSDLDANERAKLAEGWSQMDENRRRQIVHSLVELSEDNVELDFREVFLVLLEDADDEVRAAAVEGLWEDESKVLLLKLLDLLRSDPAESVRAMAAVNLGRFAYLAELEQLGREWSDKLRNALLEAIYDSEEMLEVRRRAVEAIGYYCGDEAVTEIIEEAYNDPDEHMQISAMFAMGRNMDRRWLAPLARETQSPDAARRYEAARAGGEMARPEMLPHIAPLVDDPDREVQLAAIWALGQIGGAKAAEILKACLSGEDEVLTEAAEEALDELQYSTDPLGWSLEWPSAKQ
jgi:HEAT repeat protein